MAGIQRWGGVSTIQTIWTKRREEGFYKGELRVLPQEKGVQTAGKQNYKHPPLHFKGE